MWSEQGVIAKRPLPSSASVCCGHKKTGLLRFWGGLFRALNPELAGFRHLVFLQTSNPDQLLVRSDQQLLCLVFARYLATAGGHQKIYADVMWLTMR